MGGEGQKTRNFLSLTNYQMQCNTEAVCNASIGRQYPPRMLVHSDYDGEPYCGGKCAPGLCAAYIAQRKEHQRCKTCHTSKGYQWDPSKRSCELSCTVAAPDACDRMYGCPNPEDPKRGWMRPLNPAQTGCKACWGGSGATAQPLGKPHPTTLALQSPRGSSLVRGSPVDSPWAAPYPWSISPDMYGAYATRGGLYRNFPH